MNRDLALESITRPAALEHPEMTKRVVVIASGETERRSIPHLLAHLKEQGTSVDEVRIPPNNRAINAEMAEKLVKTIWFPGPAPDKIVLLLDVDGKPPDEVVRPFRERLAARLPAEINERVQYAHAQWHLEAWYFADADSLRGYLGRDLGHVDVSMPDELQNPKNHRFVKRRSSYILSNYRAALLSEIRVTWKLS